MIYSNINDMEHFYKFKMKKVGKIAKGAAKGAVKVATSKGARKLAQGALKTGGKIGKGGLKVLDKINPLSITTGIFGGNKTMSYVCSALVCLILVAIILFQLKN